VSKLLEMGKRGKGGGKSGGKKVGMKYSRRRKGDGGGGGKRKRFTWVLQVGRRMRGLEKGPGELQHCELNQKQRKKNKRYKWGQREEMI